MLYIVLFFYNWYCEKQLTGHIHCTIQHTSQHTSKSIKLRLDSMAKNAFNRFSNKFHFLSFNLSCSLITELGLKSRDEQYRLLTN